MTREWDGEPPETLTKSLEREKDQELAFTWFVLFFINLVTVVPMWVYCTNTSMLYVLTATLVLLGGIASRMLFKVCKKKR